MIGQPCYVLLPDGTALHGKVVANADDQTPAGGPAWMVVLDNPVIDGRIPGAPLCRTLIANTIRVHLEN